MLVAVCLCMSVQQSKFFWVQSFHFNKMGIGRKVSDFVEEVSLAQVLLIG